MSPDDLYRYLRREAPTLVQRSTLLWLPEWHKLPHAGELVTYTREHVRCS